MNQQNIPIANFGVLNDDKLQALANELSLAMSRESLVACREYFLTTARRLPTAAELSMLDGLLCETASSMEYIGVSELYTDEEHLAETYADMMERRRILSPESALPPSFGELSTLGRKHLDGTLASAEQALYAAAGKTGRRKLAAKKKAKGFDDSTVAVGGANPSASICREPIVPGDTVYAVLRSFNDKDDFDEKLDLFLASGAVVNWAKEIVPIDGKSPLFSLLTIGRAVDLAPYFPAPAEDLSHPENGALLIANAQNAAELLLLSHELGLRVKRLGRIAKDNLFRIAFTQDTEKTFALEFLQSLLYTQSAPVQIDRGAPEDTLLQISPSSGFTLGRDSYLITKISADGSSTFHASLYATIGGMSAAIAAGADPATLTLTASVSAPQNKYDYASLGATLASVMGLYRAEAEFGIYNSSTSFDDTPETKAVTVWTMAPIKNAVPDTAIGGGTMLYYLEPQYGEGGLPDFEAFRKFHSYLYELHKDGIILSARAASGDLLKTLGKMSLHTEIEYVRGERINAKLGGIVVETKMNIDGLLIARTEAQTQKEVKIENSLPLTNSDN